MHHNREFRQVNFGRRLDLKRLLAALSRATREVIKNPSPGAAWARVASILIESDRTTVVLSGNRAGLDAAATSLRGSFYDVKISKVSQGDAVRPPNPSASPPRQRGQKRRRK
jgi:hypothetical protein